MEPLDGWTSGAPVAQMCVRVYGRRMSVVDVPLFRAYARGERLLRVINIITDLSEIYIREVSQTGRYFISPTRLSGAMRSE